MSQPARASSPRPSPRRIRWLWPSLALAAVALAGLFYWWHVRNAQSDGGYRTVAVERGDIRVAISATGTLSAISTVTVGSQISGQVTEVLVDYNDPVKKDQIVARIDPSTYETQIRQGNAQINAARATLAQAQATLANAELDWRRKADLGTQKLVAQSDVDLARATLDQARAAVNSAQAQIVQQTASTQTTQLNLERTVIRSPVDGVVLTRSIEPGQTVAANFSAPELFTIAEDLSKMKIELAVDESDIGQIEVGQGVSFTADAFADRQFRGKVEQVRLSATTTNNVVTYPVIVSVDNSDGTLLPGLTVNAEIEVSKRDNVLKVANAALRYKPAGQATGAAVPGMPAAPAPAGGARAGGGITGDLAQVVAGLKPSAQQQAAFDAAVKALEERQATRRAAAPQGAAGGMVPPGAMVIRGNNMADVQAQLRQRMAERFRQDFADFRATLDEAQQRQWDAALAALVNAKRATVYRLVDGKPQPLMVRIGASDGTSTEIAGGGIAEGDALVTGERAAQ
ncbi:efflux RND transporter periplasmic adaptor subunit [Stenotrophomonas sp. MMGLT7]|uniref:efflux RND transporter periplasmic adaptor subunit n=1 Tax=Stenotrophomonas sp. MMGLT7 TaxID=2901227 RepID=UPI001E2D05D7|nr:efflux RND transporter periplasmic adaptor subunit [Stenotrophomonas sp. MMGLT7]MCD7098213.1 efflux RND transporter periplasmic adaptor subunit [Stenotrophomonas sp. MMGLT7]